MVSAGTKQRTDRDILRDRDVLLLLGGLFALNVLFYVVLLRFGDVLDSRVPPRDPLVGLIVLMLVLCAAGVGLIVWTARAGHLHAAWVFAAVAVGALLGSWYALAIFPDDFHADGFFGRAFGYYMLQALVLLPIGALTVGAGLVMLWRWPWRRRVIVSLVAFPFIVQCVFHGAIGFGLLATLDRLIDRARDLNTPEAAGVEIVLVLVAVTVALSFLRRRP